MARKRGSRDKQKRKTRLKTTIGIGSGVALIGLGALTAKKIHRKIKLNQPLKGNPDLGETGKDGLEFKFQSEIKRRANLEQQLKQKKTEQYWAKDKIGMNQPKKQFRINSTDLAILGVAGGIGALRTKMVIDQQKKRKKRQSSPRKK